MSFDNAISQRAQMNIAYKQMLQTETSLERIEAIEKQIKLNLNEMETLRKEQMKIFGPSKPLKPVTTIIEMNKEGGVDKTILNAPAPEVPVEEVVAVAPSPSRLGNSLRTAFKSKQALSAEESLKAKIAAAKAAKK